jgi:sensitive to high expression protein 9
MATRQAARDAKASYAAAVMQRSNSQREVNDLLQRKSLWTDGDVGRFTTLVRQDHLYEQEEARTKASVDETEAAVEREFSELMRSILARYHEEQVWSDKIRSASTYGSLAALGLNLVVFLLAIVVVEPWKRRRLAMTFEERVTDMAAENKAMIHEGVTTLLKQMEEQGSLFNERLDSVMEHNPDTSRAVGVSTSASSVAKAASDREIGIAVAASVMIAGAIGWIAHGLVRL